jgi:hypothetical protein
LTIYLWIGFFSIIAFLACGIGFLLVAEVVQKPIHKDWRQIYVKIKESGYDISESTFTTFVEINLKFAGMFSIVFSFFLILGFISAIFLRPIIRDMKAKEGRSMTPSNERFNPSHM